MVRLFFILPLNKNYIVNSLLLLRLTPELLILTGLMFSKIISRIIFVLLLLSTFTALVYPKTLFYSYDSEKGLFFRFLIEIIMGLWVILCLKEPSFRPRRTFINSALALLTLVLIVVDMLGIDTYLSVFSNFERMAGLMLYLCVFGYYLVISSVVNTPKRWLIIGLALSITAFIVAIKGIMQGYNQEEMILNNGRVVSTIGNANQLASYLLLGFFIVGLLITTWILPLLKTKPIIAKLYIVIASIMLGVYLWCFLQTSARGALAGLLLAIVVMTMITFFTARQPIVKRGLAIGFLGLLLLLSTIFYFRKEPFVQQNSALNRITRITDSDGTNTLQSRIENYKIALDGIKARPFLGWGQETYHYTYAQYFNPTLYADAAWYDRVHNVLLEWLVTGGILGLIAYILLWVAVVYQLWQKNSALNLKHKIFLSGFLVAYFISNISLFDNLLSLMAFMTVMAFIENHSRPQVVEPYRILHNKVIMSGSMITIAMVFFLLNMTKQAYQTNKAIANAYRAGSLEEVIETYAQAYPKALIGRQEVAEQLVNITQDVKNSNVPKATQVHYFEVATKIMQAEITHHPHYARLQIIYGNLLEAQGKIAEATKVFEHVQELAPKRQNSLIQLAMLYAQNKQFEKASTLLQNTYLLEPKHEEVKVFQAIVMAMNGEKQQSDTLLKGLSQTALNKYIVNVKYAYSLTNDWAGFFELLKHTSDKTTEPLYHEWAVTAYQLKNYEQVSMALFLYRTAYSGYKFVDTRTMTAIRQDAMSGRNPEFAFERTFE